MSLKAAEIFKKMAAQLPTHGEHMVSKVGCVYAFEIRKNKGDKPTLFTVDLKNGKGRIEQGKIDGLKPDCTFVMLDDDYAALVGGKLKPQNAFMQVSLHPLLISPLVKGQNENQRQHEGRNEVQAKRPS